MPEDNARFRNLMHALAEDAANTPTSEIVAEMRADGLDPVAIGKQVRANLLARVRKVYRDRRTELAGSSATLPRCREALLARISTYTSTQTRDLFKRAVAAYPQALTAHGRSETEVTDGDMLIMLEKLFELGALDELLP